MRPMQMVFAAALLVPFLATSLSAQQAAPMNKTRAVRAECFRQANQAAQAQVDMASANPAAAARLERIAIMHAYAKRTSGDKCDLHRY